MNRSRHAVALGLCVGLVSCGEAGPGEPQEEVELYTVERGDLRIDVSAPAELQAAQSTRIVSGVGGLSTLVYLVPEGTYVQEGDKLAELDTSELRERRASQAIEVAKAKSALDQAGKNFETLEASLQAVEQAAQGSLTMARMRHEKFVSRPASEGSAAETGTNGEMVTRLRELVEEEIRQDAAAEANAGLVGTLIAILGGEENLGREMGEIANLVLRQIDAVTLARANVELAEDTLTRSEGLLQQGFISRPDVEKDRVALRSQQSKLSLAWNNLALLIKFNLKERLVSLEQDVSNAELELNTVLARNEAARVGKQAELASADAEHRLALERLENWDTQIENAVIIASTPGLVVYAQEGTGRNPVQQGMQVRDQQDLITLPDVTRMVAEMELPEGLVELVKIGQKAEVRLSSLPSRAFTATVSRVGSLPTSGGGAGNLYSAAVELDGDNAGFDLRPGMNAKVVILAGVVEDTLSVPLSAVQRKLGQQYVWIEDGGPRAVPVELGEHSATHVQVVSGLGEGDRVYLGQPPGAPTPDFR